MQTTAVSITLGHRARRSEKLGLRLIAFAATCLLGLPAGPVARGDDLAALEQLTIQQAVAAADPSIVRIETVGGVDLVGELLTATGPTTGVIVRADGYILTSQFNFVSRPSSILVTLADERRFAAEVISSDDSKMLTLLKIDASDLIPMEAVPVDQIRVGQRAIALGRIFDLKFPNLSIGIVSALQRISGRALQTDAKTSPVNYGGPLIDLTGRCLGIIVPLSPQETGETAGMEWYDSGIGFAVPLAEVEPVLNRMIAGETLKRGLLGVSFEDQGPLSGEAKVVRVHPESPADLAGLKVDDVITAINGRPIKKLNDLKQALGVKYAQDEITLALQRGESSVETKLTLAAEIKPYQFPYLGILPERVPDTTGPVKVWQVLPESPAATAGMLAGDEILKVGENAITDREQFTKRIRRSRPGTILNLEVQRGGEPKVLQVELTTLTDTPPEVEAKPVRKPEKAGTALTGRLNEQLPGDGLSFWAYVPENYRADNTWGLLVWLHPAGETMEAEMLRAWSETCQERGLILVAPRAGDLAGWGPEQEDQVQGIVEWMQERYRIDPARITVMGLDDAGLFASRLAFKYRDLFRGMIVIQAPLRSHPPGSEPELPLQGVFLSDPAGERATMIEQSVNLMREQNLPTLALPWATEAPGTFPTEAVEVLGNWLDALDRI